jgi:hypothetical protein
MAHFGGGKKGETASLMIGLVGKNGKSIAVLVLCS